MFAAVATIIAPTAYYRKSAVECIYWTRAIINRRHQRRGASSRRSPIKLNSRAFGSKPGEGPHQGCSESQHGQRNAECDACAHRKDRPRSRTADSDLSIGERTIWPLGGDGGSRVKLLLDLRVADECNSKHKQHRANDPQPEEATSPIHCLTC